jgi:hypothetical protein
MAEIGQNGLKGAQCAVVIASGDGLFGFRHAHVAASQGQVIPHDGQPPPR